MRSNRLPLTTVLSLGFALFTIACVPKAPKMSSGDDGGIPATEPPVGGVTACQFNDMDVTDVVADGGVGGEKMACTNVTSTCFPYVRPYTAAQDAWYSAKAAELMRGMANNHKANQLRGTDFNQFNDIERTWHDVSKADYADTKGVREFKFRDASRGLNFAVEFQTGATNYATAFPVSMARGASFDLDLEYRIGQAAGDEMVASGNTMLLAPCVNILRHPLWGRAQETYGEDSFMLGRLGTAYTIGLQEYVASCAKHYAANNVENGRQTANAVLDEQTLREIYGRHFEMIVRDGGIASLMASYNKVNGEYSTTNKHTLTDILRGPAATGGFEFRGFVLSDWWAMENHITDQPSSSLAARGIKAGLDMELGWNLNFRTLESNVDTHNITQEELDTATQRVLAQKIRFKGTDPNGPVGLRATSTSYSASAHSITNNEAVDQVQGKSHIALAQEAAVKSMVLLKNDNKTLPIKRDVVKKVAVLGRVIDYHYMVQLAVNDENDGVIDFARTPRTGDLGSSRVFIDKSKASGPLQGITEAAGNGISVMAFDNAAAAIAFNPDFVVVVAGLTPKDEGEEYTLAGDRENFDLDAKAYADNPATGGQIKLINDAIAMAKPMVLVLEGASVINIPSLAQLPAVVMAWYPGMDGGRALGKLLFGDANFSGKLPFTWPKQLSDIPYLLKENQLGDSTMDYYLGYRMYDERTKRLGSSAPTPLFAFGYGLSYSKFTYKNLHIPCTTVDENSTIDITVDVTNTGDVDGEEIVFLFASYPDTTARRSIKELKGFRKVMIPHGRTKQVHIPLRIKDLKYFKMDNPTATTGSFVVEKGTVKLMVGGSSDSLPVSDMFTVN